MANGVTDVIKGGAIQIGVKSVDHIAFNYLVKSGKYTDQQLRQNIWFKEVDPAIPPVDNIVLNLGLPAVLLIGGKMTKNKGAVAMGIGAALTGGAAFIADLLGRSAARPNIPFSTASYTPPGNVQERPQPTQHSSNGTLWV